jgi:hypothetical protein
MLTSGEHSSSQKCTYHLLSNGLRYDIVGLCGENGRRVLLMIEGVCMEACSLDRPPW